jgi:hypothetical protein
VRPQAVVVALPEDQLADAVEQALAARSWPSSRRLPGELASTPLVLDEQTARLGDEPVGAVVFRARPDMHFGEDFDERDAGFASSEARAAWLALTHLPSVSAINRLDAELWFSSAEWPIWRRRLVRAGVRVVDLAVGDAAAGEGATWLPWGGGLTQAPPRSVRRTFATALVDLQALQTTVTCCGAVLDGPDLEVTRAASAVLAADGARLAAIVTDDRERIVSCTAYPYVPPAAVQEAAESIVEALDADLAGR